MPKRKRSTKRRFSKRRRKSTRRSRTTMSSIGKTNPFPKKFMTTLRYETAVDIDPPLGGTASHLFRAGSIYDPDFSGLGGQPRYTDQILPLYDHFTVIGSKITVKVANPHTTQYIVGIQLNGNGQTVSSVNDLIEQRNSSYKWIGHAYMAGSIATIKKTYSPKKFLGIKSPLSEAELRGTISSNPAEDAYYAVTVGSHDPAINGNSLPLRVIIDYIVVFTEPRTVASS